MPKTTLSLPTNEAKYDRAARFSSVFERLNRRVRYSEGGCHIWTRATSTGGYGILTVDKQCVYAHRLAYWLHRGPIEPGMTVDHLCRVRACINPDHLRIVSNSVNASETARSAQTHCNRGHAFDAANSNVIVDKNGYPHRYCRACNRERCATWKAAKRRSEAA